MGGRTPVERGGSSASSRWRCRPGREEAAELVVEETGKSLELALGEVDAAVEMGFFVAGEGRRLYGRTTTSVDAEPDGDGDATPGRRCRV